MKSSFEKEIEAFVLAGGKSSRMGRNKGMIRVAGKPMIAHIVDTLDMLGFQVEIIGTSEYEMFGKKVHQDIIPEKGPMGGLYTALSACTKEQVLLTGCDMPFLPFAAFSKLTRNKDLTGIKLGTLNGQLQPLIGLYPAHLIKSVERAILSDHLKMIDFVRCHTHTLIEMDEIAIAHPNGFLNFNTPQSIHDFEKTSMQICPS